LAKNRLIGSLILMAPFTSLQNVVGDFLGGCLKKIYRERFENYKII
jgi:hypothetical protein